MSQVFNEQLTLLDFILRDKSAYSDPPPFSEIVYGFTFPIYKTIYPLN